MDDDLNSMIISGDTGKITLSIFPEPGARPDEAGFTWFRCTCVCEIGPFGAEFPLQMTGHDIRSMHDDLVALSLNAVSEAIIANMEEDISLTLAITKTGSVIVDGRINPRVADYATLQFNFRSDLQTIASCADTVRRLYPFLPTVENI